MSKKVAAEMTAYAPVKGDRVKVGSGKVVWIIEGFLTLHGGAEVVALTREGSNGYTNTTVEPGRLKPATATPSKG